MKSMQSHHLFPKNYYSEIAEIFEKLPEKHAEKQTDSKQHELTLSLLSGTPFLPFYNVFMKLNEIYGPEGDYAKKYLGDPAYIRCRYPTIVLTDSDKHMLAYDAEYGGNRFYHCSAGVGRSVAIVMMRMLYELICKKNLNLNQAVQEFESILKRIKDVKPRAGEWWQLLLAIGLAEDMREYLSQKLSVEMPLSQDRNVINWMRITKSWQNGMFRGSLSLRNSDKSNLYFTELGLGCAPIGNYPTYLSDEQAHKTIQRALDLGIRIFDTAPLYGYGLSEIRLGDALLKSNVSRKSVFISSKVGRILIPDNNSKEHDLFPQSRPYKDVFDYSYDGILNSIQGSLERLKTNYLDVAHIHDLGEFTHGDMHIEMLDAFVNSGYQAMLELRQQGIIKAIGLGVNEFDVALELMQKYEIDFDCIMLAQRYTLLEQGEKANEFFLECEKRQISVMIASPLSSGILSDNPQNTAFRYAPAPKEILDKKTKIKEICNNHGVALQQAALHFPLLQPSVKTAVMGARSPEEIDQAFQNVNKLVPPVLWDDLKNEGLLSIISEENLTISQADRITFRHN